jgi:hypothetical protein
MCPNGELASDPQQIDRHRQTLKLCKKPGLPPLAQRSAKKLMNDIEDASLSLAIELEGQC